MNLALVLPEIRLRPRAQLQINFNNTNGIAVELQYEVDYTPAIRKIDLSTNQLISYFPAQGTTSEENFTRAIDNLILNSMATINYSLYDEDGKIISEESEVIMINEPITNYEVIY
ncbi:hypothetical protein GCM10009117_05220 [Gangjinia marincola]|uniref:Uncharacterized protein n=1 Tax=Gangjinia marincola TaxID=578463 RepID=A0ABP3XQ16_9FLAO